MIYDFNNFDTDDSGYAESGNKEFRLYGRKWSGPQEFLITGIVCKEISLKLRCYEKYSVKTICNKKNTYFCHFSKQ